MYHLVPTTKSGSKLPYRLKLHQTSRPLQIPYLNVYMTRPDLAAYQAKLHCEVGQNGKNFAPWNVGNNTIADYENINSPIVTTSIVTRAKCYYNGVKITHTHKLCKLNEIDISGQGSPPALKIIKLFNKII
jgi:hypothetical protein